MGDRPRESRRQGVPKCLIWLSGNTPHVQDYRYAVLDRLSGMASPRSQWRSLWTPSAGSDRPFPTAGHRHRTGEEPNGHRRGVIIILPDALSCLKDRIVIRDMALFGLMAQDEAGSVSVIQFMVT